MNKRKKDKSCGGDCRTGDFACDVLHRYHAASGGIHIFTEECSYDEVQKV